MSTEQPSFTVSFSANIIDCFTNIIYKKQVENVREEGEGGGRFLTDLNPINAVHFLLPERLSFFILFYKAHSYNVFIYNMYVYI